VTAMSATDPAQTLLAAAARLAAKGLLRPGDSLSCRLPASAEMLWLVHDEAGAAPRRVGFAGAEPVPPTHRAAYVERADVGAVLLARLPWAAALHGAGATLTGVFDEQLRHLGAQVAPLGAGAALGDGANAYLTRDGALCLGMTLERLVFNAELLEKCAQAYALALASGNPVRRIPWLVRHIATGRLKRDQRRAAEHHARGEAAPRVAGY